MCLTKTYTKEGQRILLKKYPSILPVYKVVDVFPSMGLSDAVYYTLLFPQRLNSGLNTMLNIPNWRTPPSTRKSLRASDGRFYPCGFHSFLTRSDANQYFSFVCQRYLAAEGSFLAVRKFWVLKKHITCLGTQTGSLSFKKPLVVIITPYLWRGEKPTRDQFLPDLPRRRVAGTQPKK